MHLKISSAKMAAILFRGRWVKRDMMDKTAAIPIVIMYRDNWFVPNYESFGVILDIIGKLACTRRYLVPNF